MNSTVYTLRNV